MPPPPPPPPQRGTLSRQLTLPRDGFAQASSSGEPTSPGGRDPISATNASASNAVWQPLVAGVTDPGVAGKQNQDDFFVWQSDDGQSVVMAVLDGHGRDQGQLAARVARDSLAGALAHDAGLAAVRADPRGALTRAFKDAHAAVEAAFRKVYEDAGWAVSKGAGRDGYLTRSRPGVAGGVPQCVHGGTTATVVVLLGGARVVVANVGDSTALLCGLPGGAARVRPGAAWTPMPAGAAAEGAAAAPGGGGGGRGGGGGSGGSSPRRRLATALPPGAAEAATELSADHSPESPDEFLRVAAFRPSPTDPARPELQFVYDTLTANKTACPHIFEPGAKPGPRGKPAVSDAGVYYKNVRSEWASLCATPPHALFQDALAFTRSLGDLHLQTYGVSHEPEVFWLDVAAAAAPLAGAGGAGAAGAGAGAGAAGSDAAADALARLSLSAGAGDGAGAPGAAPAGAGAGAGAPGALAPVVPHPLAIVLCSDGVWDNWQFAEVSAFALDAARVEAVAAAGSAAAAASELMAANLESARVNFGSSADNMTCITLYLLPRV